MPSQNKPVVLITGSAGKIGRALASHLHDDFTVIGIDKDEQDENYETVSADLTNRDSIKLALYKIREKHGEKISSVVHLAAYFDFTGEDHPLYEALNVSGTRALVECLGSFTVGQFIYSGTMLVHAACEPGQRIDETAPVDPKWPYPRSKAAAEEAIREAHGDIPYVLLHLAGVYDEKTAVPTLSHQIARIYERDLKSHFYAGDMLVGQSLIHLDDLVDLVRRTIEQRQNLPPELTLLAGEPDAVGYGVLQDNIGRLIHGDAEWQTMSVPKPIAKASAWLETHSEPVVPDALDKGEKPFIRPFMIEMASDHYALDITRAKSLLGWQPNHDIQSTLPDIIDALKNDPLDWYQTNGITPPDWLITASEKSEDPEALRTRYEDHKGKAHRAYLWSHFFTMLMGAWLLTSPAVLNYGAEELIVSDMVSGAILLVLGLLTLRPDLSALRWLTASVGLWVMFAPILFWAGTAAGYLNGTLVGAIVVGLSAAIPPPPGVDPAAAMTGPYKPKGWDFSPSAWSQRLPIIFLAFIGFVISRHLAAYQMGHTDGIWDPFFGGNEAGLNGSEEIVTSFVSEAWPVSDAALGAFVYMLEILTGVIGSTRRWRTMPWLVLLFGFLIVPLGAVSITFIVIQPILIGTWCTLCLVAAAAMLLQIPYSLDELFATSAFLLRRWRAGRPILRVLFRGDTDDGSDRPDEAEFERPFTDVLFGIWRRGLTVPWSLALCALIGVGLMFSRALFGTSGGMAESDHLIGALILTFTVTALAEVARIVRLLNIPLGMALLVTPFIFATPTASLVFSLVAGLALIILSIPKGRIVGAYGDCQKLIV